MTGLSALALVLCIILSWHDLAGGSMIGCNPGSPECDQVLGSRWSTIAGVLPVSGLAVGVYLALLVASFFIGPDTEVLLRRLVWSAILVLVGSAAGSAIWFTIAQKWIIGVFCPYCMTIHLIGLLLAALVIWQAPRQLDGDSTDAGCRRTSDVGLKSAIAVAPQSKIRNRKSAIGLGLAGLALAGILAASQVVFTPPSIFLDGEAQDNLSVIDPHDALLVGSPDATYVVTLLFDYQCPRCQQMHFLLNEVIRRYGGKLAFALSPAPLSSRCNPYIPRDVDEYKDSCDLVKVGLAVWVARREAFPAFENWMFTFESGDRWRPRNLDAARAKAIELVGQAKFDAALADPWIERYVQTSIRIYGQTIQGGKGGVPKLIFGSRWAIPQPSNANDLVMILQQSLDVPAP